MDRLEGKVAAPEEDLQEESVMIQWRRILMSTWVTDLFLYLFHYLLGIKLDWKNRVIASLSNGQQLPPDKKTPPSRDNCPLSANGDLFVDYYYQDDRIACCLAWKWSVNHFREVVVPLSLSLHCFTTANGIKCVPK